MGGDMELVRQFNSELSSIYEGKPPISKAKMASITRYAVKALKYYKHIVHSVEKFIQKCRDEYKICGLYVLDSIIRQSRHQFGFDKDLFGPRFQRNLKLLFQHIFQCPHEDKPKIVRVLNLWQKNGIYSPDVISPLIDMASTSSKVLAAQVQRQRKAKASASSKLDHDLDTFDTSFDPPASFVENLPVENKKRRIQMSQDDEIQVLKAQLEQQRKQQELLQQQLQMQIMATKQQSLQLQLQQQQMQNKMTGQIQATTLDVMNTNQQPVGNQQADLLSQIQELTNQLDRDKAALANIANEGDQQPPPQLQTTVQSSVDNQTQFLENFQNLIQTAKGIMQKDPRQQNNNNINTDVLPQGREVEPSPKFNQALLDTTFEYDDDDNMQQDNRATERQFKDEENKMQRVRDGDPRGPPPQNFQLPQYKPQQSSFPPQQPSYPQQRPPFQQQESSFQSRPPSFQQQEVSHQSAHRPHPFQQQQHHNRFSDEQPPQKKPLLDFHQELNRQQQQQQLDDDDAMQIDNDEECQEEFYEPKPEPLPPPNQRKSRWEPRRPAEDRSGIMRAIDIAKERINTEEEEILELKRREKSVMPPAMHNRMTVASVTVWVGRLPKGCDPNIVREAFSEFGEVKSIDLIDARGCAFVTLGSRYQADKALRHLRHRRLDGYDTKMAWGQPKGLQDFSKFWEESFGSAFIPWGLIKEYHLSSLSDGCIIAEDTLPPGMSLPKQAVMSEPEGNNQTMIPPPLVRPMFLNNLPPGMLPPPPPPGMMPPMGIPGMLPMGFRPTLRPPMRPAMPQPQQNVLSRPHMPPSNMGGARGPLLQRPQENRGSNINISIANLFPRNSAAMTGNGRPLVLSRPPFNLSAQPPLNLPRGNEIIFNGQPFQINQPNPGVRDNMLIRPPLIQSGIKPAWEPVSQAQGKITSSWLEHKDPEDVQRKRMEIKPEPSDQEFKSHKLPTVLGKVENLVSVTPDKFFHDQPNQRDTPDKSSDEQDRRNRDSDRERENKNERRDRFDRRDDRTDRRDRDRKDNREREERDDRNRRDSRGDRGRYERGFRADRNRFGRDERDHRNERYDREARDRFSREDRDGRQRENNRDASRDKFGRDEFGRDEDRSRKNDRDRDGIKSQDRDVSKGRSPKPDRGLPSIDKERRDLEPGAEETPFKSTFLQVASQNENLDTSVTEADKKRFVPFAVTASSISNEGKVQSQPVGDEIEEQMSDGIDDKSVVEDGVQQNDEVLKPAAVEKDEATDVAVESELYDPLEAANMSPEPDNKEENSGNENTDQHIEDKPESEKADHVPNEVAQSVEEEEGHAANQAGSAPGTLLASIEEDLNTSPQESRENDRNSPHNTDTAVSEHEVLENSEGARDELEDSGEEGVQESNDSPIFPLDNKTDAIFDETTNDEREATEEKD